jgi:hypothetical protein
LDCFNYRHRPKEKKEKNADKNISLAVNIFAP